MEYQKIISAKENIANIFSMFHDGCFLSHDFDGDELSLTIEIMYLAERVDPEFTKFRVKLIRPSNISFCTWPINLDNEPTLITDLSEIFHDGVGILQAKLEGHTIEVACDQISSDRDYCGGVLAFEAKSVIVLDEAGKEYSIVELGQLCTAYWSNFGLGKTKHV